MKRFAVAAATLALALTLTPQAGAAPASTDVASTITPRAYKNIMLWFTNDSNRVLHFKVTNGFDPYTGTELTLYPGRTQQFYGRTGQRYVDLQVSWCPDQVRLECADKLTARVWAANPVIGYPSMGVDKDQHGFKALERYTFEKAYGHAAQRGVAKFKTLREVDTDLKRFRMAFSYAAPAA